MKHGAVHDANAEVGGAAAARCELEIDATHAAVCIEADRPVEAEIVPLASHHHVVVAIKPKLARPPGNAGPQRGNDRPLRRLRFLAAKATAHATHLASDKRVGHAKHAGHDMLDLGGMLGRRMHQHVIVFARHGKCDLALQIKMLLAADPQNTAQAMLRPGDRSLGIAADEFVVG